MVDMFGRARTTMEMYRVIYLPKVWSENERKQEIMNQYNNELFLNVEVAKWVGWVTGQKGLGEVNPHTL